MSDTITETVSEKRRSGRPSVFDFSLLTTGERVQLESVMPRGTKRTRLNFNYMSVGCGVIQINGKVDPRYTWIHDGERMRMGALVELGRIAKDYGEDAARILADTLIGRVVSGKLSTT